HMTSGVVEHKAIHVESEDHTRISIIGIGAIAGRRASYEALLAFPTRVLGTEYEVLTYEEPPNIFNGESFFAIVAAQADTWVQVNLPNQMLSPAPIHFENAGDTYLLTSADDLTGTIVQSTNY